ncbi:hypothetical protein PSTT_01456 [Puccinia striiformis]|uniref:Uncharacterized protein n=1 Tax=Puccinia striiformis TaxID=27350 RepID=A0A2S4W3G5_9BASI|nr:hypothetical protein PSTT_01456 [Puccinia striiformis]
MLPEANRNPPATEYYQEMTTTEEEDNTPASKKQVVSANHSLASAAIPRGEGQSSFGGQILREQQLDRLKNIADHRLKTKHMDNHLEALVITWVAFTRSISQDSSNRGAFNHPVDIGPLTCHTDGNICNAINMRISELVALQERTYELLQQAEKRASEEEVRAATREAQANRRADMLEQMLLSLPGPNNFTIY